MKNRSTRSNQPRRALPKPAPALPSPSDAETNRIAADDDDEIRYSLTLLGEAVLNDRRGRFRGFGPCVRVA
jgi:hypothetical protein